jgi:hypothetical protein
MLRSVNRRGDAYDESWAVPRCDRGQGVTNIAIQGCDARRTSPLIAFAPDPPVTRAICAFAAGHGTSDEQDGWRRHNKGLATGEP